MTDIFDMSEEEFSALTPDKIRESFANANSSEQVNANDDPSNQSKDEQGSELNTEELDNTDNGLNDDTDSDNADSNSGTENQPELDNDSDVNKDPENKSESSDKNAEDNAVNPEHTDFFKAVTSEFKANGQTYSFNKPEEIIALMQKGINYTHKMQNIKQYVAAGELLKANDLLDPNRLSFLIDLNAGKPEAIAKLIKEKNIDAYSLDENTANNYEETSVDISGSNQELRDVIDDFKGDEAFTTLYNEAATWDDKSQNQLVEQPSIFRVLHSHVQTGLYAEIMKEVNRQRVLGNNGPILDLYYSVGTHLVEANAKAAQANKPTNATNTAPRKVTKVATDVEQRRQSAAANPGKRGNGTATPKITSASDIYSMSEEEFSKLSPSALRSIK